MKTRDVLIVGGIAVLLYYFWYRGRKKPVVVADLTNKNPLGGGAAPTEVPAVEVTLKQPLTVEDMPNKNAVRGAGRKATVRNARKVSPQAQPPMKEPIFMPRNNAIPNAYNDNIGLTVERPTIVHQAGDYQNFVGNTTSIQCACKTDKKRTQRYRTNLPQLP